MRTPALLAILDGVGLREATSDNALACADAPFLHELFADGRYPCRALAASGRDVGLPDGQMGNSEVGHLNIGAGRIIRQELSRIDLAIDDGSLATNAVLLNATTKVMARDATLHLMGLLSDGGVHSMQSHLEALIKLTVDDGVRRIRIHAFLDGRDVAPTSGAGYVQALADFCQGMARSYPGLDVRIGTLAGRYYAMDRDNRWERVEQAWQALVEPLRASVLVDAKTDPVEPVRQSYDKGVTDEFLVPVAIGADAIRDGDVVLFFNFRPDRARELTRAFVDPDFSGFARPIRPRVDFVSMTEYDPAFEHTYGVKLVFPKTFPVNTLAAYLSSLKLRQFHIAETEKYAHVTFFFNGGVEAAKAGEERLLVPSPKVATYDLKPQMSAPEVTEQLLAAIQRDAADVYIVNYANGDMVGHTGIQAAVEAALHEVDRGLEQVVEAIAAKGGFALVTADHGNSEQMCDEQGGPWTAHTCSPVPLVYLDPYNSDRHIDFDRQGQARLADIAPTLLDAMELPAPEEFTGRSLLIRSDEIAWEPQSRFW